MSAAREIKAPTKALHFLGCKHTLDTNNETVRERDIEKMRGTSKYLVFSGDCPWCKKTKSWGGR